MRLIHVPSRSLCEFLSELCPDYAIISHTWGSEEVSYHDFLENKAGKKAGYQKIRYLCNQATKDGLDYVWIDTACIDKTSSAELSEAINSMMLWYENAEVCYAYLEDVQELSHFEKCRWFTRGWTLQELIAPRSLQFYGVDWKYLGNKSTLMAEITAATGINPIVFESPKCFTVFSIATRMSWAARRTTSRVEDMAYCLLGIFEVNMPTLYGEREKAFNRLQHELIKVSHDESILAWNFRGDNFAAAFMGLATDPSWFLNVPSIVPLKISETHQPWSINSRGLLTHMPLLGDVQGKFWAILNCRYECCLYGYVGVPLIYDFMREIYFRDEKNSPRLISIEEAQRAESRPFYINTTPDLIQQNLFIRCICLVQSDSLTSHGYQIIHSPNSSRKNAWNAETQISEGFQTDVVRDLEHRFLFYNRTKGTAFKITVVDGARYINHTRGKHQMGETVGFTIEHSLNGQDFQDRVDGIRAHLDPTLSYHDMIKLKLLKLANFEVHEQGSQCPLQVSVSLKRVYIMEELVIVLTVSAIDKKQLKESDPWDFSESD